MTAPTMEALLFRREIGRYLLTRAVYATMPRLWTARLAPLHHVRLPVPGQPREGWVRLRVRRSGICGTDFNLMTARDSLYFEPEATYPFVPGHEIVAEVDAGGSLPRGTRVAVWPILSCHARGRAPCPSCAAGWDGLCDCRNDAWPGQGIALGFNAETGGGWSEYCIAHESQLWALPETVADDDALLLDPAAAALAALLRTESAPGDRTLVIGGGTIGLLLAYLHAALGRSGSCELLVRHETQRMWARAHGINAVAVRSDAEFRSWASDQGIAASRVSGYGWVFRGKYDRVIDAAGTRSSINWTLAAVRARGCATLVTAPASLAGIDPSPIWYRELTCRGIYQYGPVPWEGEWMHPYRVVLPLLADGTLNFSDWVTHTFSLAEFGRAFQTLAHRHTTGAIKVAFQPWRTVRSTPPRL